MNHALPFLLASQLLLPPATPSGEMLAPNAALVVANAALAGTTRIPDQGVLEERETIIGKIVIRNGDIFDPEDEEENNRLYLLANKLHRKTRQEMIRRLLLFDTGERFSRYRIEESERILRSQIYLYDAEIVPVAYDGQRVDLEVRTRDVWTLKVGVSVSRSGGTNESSAILQDSNFFGTGKELTLKRSADVDRAGYLVRFLDPNLMGARTMLEAIYADNDDGEFQKFKINRPFYSLESRWGGGVQVISNDRINSLYSLGKVADEFRHQEVYAEAWVGRSNGMEDNRSRRWLLGFSVKEDKFGPAHPAKPSPSNSGSPFDAFIPDAVPQPETLIREDLFPDRSLENRKFAYPWIGFEMVQNRYSKTHDLNSLHRTEDLRLGHYVHARLGWSSPMFSGTQERAIFSAVYGYGLKHDEDHLLFVKSRLGGRVGSDGAENLTLGLSTRFYWRNLGEHTFVAALDLDAAESLDAENQLLLGGDTGLRGYPLRYQEGDRRILLTLEQRFYTNWHPFRLAYLGAAIFVDTGQAWSPGFDREIDRGWLTNIGVGLRVSPSRSGFGSMIHADIAYPVNPPDGIDSIQYLVSTKETF